MSGGYAGGILTRRLWRGAALVLLALAVVAAGSRYALLSMVLESARVLLLLTPAALAGLWLVPLLRLGALPVRWHLLLGIGLGIGGLSLLVLGLGTAGCLSRPLWILWLAVLFVLGLLRLGSLPRPRLCESSGTWLLALAVPFATLAFLAASHAPGFIWTEEGFGYDVLEYHLQMPKEYLAAGAVVYAPHNVYANFPANVEMLYLLAMVIFGEPIEAGITCNVIHLSLGALAVFAAWVVGSDRSPRCGVICAVLLATAGWLQYVSGLAYVEHGLLFFGMAATGAALRAISAVPRHELSGDPPGERDAALGWSAAAGVMAGLACGCKYTAVALIAAPLLLIILAGSNRRRLLSAALFALTAAVAFAPWLIKNHVMTGNPVFPLANDVFRASPPGWGPECTTRWQEGHTVRPDERAVGARLQRLWRTVLWDRHHRFGPMIFLLAIAGIIAGRFGRIERHLLFLLAAQLLLWMSVTHLYGRFAVVLMIPLALLGGSTAVGNGRRLWWRFACVAIAAGAAWNFYYAFDLHRHEAYWGAPAAWFAQGMVPGYEHYGAVNNDLPENARVLLIGEARAFYFRRTVDYHVVFNRNPFVAVLKRAEDPHDVLDWLSAQGYTHLLVHWGEVHRLRSTYGFAEEVNPEQFGRLREAGLYRLQAFQHPATGRPFVELFAVPPARRRGGPDQGQAAGPENGKGSPRNASTARVTSRTSMGMVGSGTSGCN